MNRIRIKTLKFVLLLSILAAEGKAGWLIFDPDSTEIPYGLETSDQTERNPLTIALRGHYGFVIQHSQDVRSVQGAHPKGIELDFGWQLNSKEVWDDCQCYPRLGFIASYFDYDNSEVLGQGYSSAIYFSYFFGLPKTTNFFLKGGAGFTYLNRIHDPVTNPTNMSYATYINFLLFVNLGLNLRLSDHWEMEFAGGMNHKSNAGIKEPNGGINFPTVSLALGYTIDPIKFVPKTHPDPYMTSSKKKRWDIAAYIGFSAINFPDSGQFPIYGLWFARSIQIWRISAISFGGEIEMNGRAREKIKRYFQDKSVSPWRASVHVGHEFLMGRTIFSIHLGFYVYRPMVESDIFYQRYGLMYRILPNLFAGINFKAYRHTADVLDARLTFTF